MVGFFLLFTVSGECLQLFAVSGYVYDKVVDNIHEM